jgi:hypothetical protein
MICCGDRGDWTAGLQPLRLRVGQLPLAMAAALPQPTIAFGETDQLLQRAIAKRTTAMARDACSMPLRFTSAAAQLGQIAISRFLASTLLAALFISGLLALTGCERPSPPATLDSLGTPSALQPAEPRVNSEIRAGPNRSPIFESRGVSTPGSAAVTPVRVLVASRAAK